MTTAFALEYIKRRMREIGLGDDYYLKWRHFVLSPSEVRKITGGDDLFVLINDIPNIPIDEPVVRVESDFGIWDFSETTTNELIYEHRGHITLTNTDTDNPSYLVMVQVIPANPKEDGDILS